MSWCCLTSGDEHSAIKIKGYARNDDAREALSKLRGASDFYAPHHPPLNPLNPFNLLNLFRKQSKSGTPPGLTLKFESRDEWLGIGD